MPLSRLLQPKSSLQIHRYGFPKTIRWFSPLSSDAEIEKPLQSKKTCMPRDQRTVAAESFVRKYMETNPGEFPKASHIQNEVGGSWYTVKKILHNIKEKMPGTPKLENHNNIHALTPAKETTFSAVMTSHPLPDKKIELQDHPKTLVHADQVLQTQDKDGNIGHSTSKEAGESSSALTVDIAASEVTDMRNFSPSCELQIPPTAQGTKSGSDYQASAADASENVKVDLSRKYNSEGMVQLNAVTDSLQLELDSQHMQPKESVSNMCETSDRCLVSNSKKFSHFGHDNLDFKGCGEQQENRTMPCGLSPNSSVEMSTQSALSDTSQKVSRLADIFKKLTDDAAVAESKNENMECEESLSNILLSYGKDRNSQAKSLLSADILQPSESIAKWQDHRVNKPVSGVYENQRPRKEMIASSLKENVTPSMVESFTGSNNLMGLDDMKGNTKRVHGFFEHTEEPMLKDESKRSELKDLIEYIKGLPGDPSVARPSEKISCKTDDSEKRKLESESLATLQSFDKKERNISADCCAVHGKSKDDDSIKALPVGLRTQGDETSKPDYNKPGGRAQLAVLPDKKELNDIQQKIFIMEEPDQNKAVVKFLFKTTQKKDIVDAFQQCGDILKVEILSTEKSFYRSANIYFKTREGLQNALEKTDMLVKNANITVEAAGSQEAISNRISIPSLIGDPNVPGALVKNPMRTVKITQLTRDISSHDVVAVLASCGVNVTGFFLGTLNSVAYVEFETEDDKEIALANHSIYILGKQLLIYRIDAPRTTVVRISHNHSIKANKAIQVCKSLGKIRSFSMRQPGVVDVHFKLAEWPNMLKILNRLNGAKVDGHTLLAQPASVFPPDVLRILWSQPEERKYVKTVVQKLLQKLGENVVDKVELTGLADFY